MPSGSCANSEMPSRSKVVSFRCLQSAGKSQGTFPDWPYCLLKHSARESTLLPLSYVPKSTHMYMHTKTQHMHTQIHFFLICLILKYVSQSIIIYSIFQNYFLKNTYLQLSKQKCDHHWNALCIALLVLNITLWKFPTHKKKWYRMLSRKRKNAHLSSKLNLHTV